jgi:hypothetical protein
MERILDDFLTKPVKKWDERIGAIETALAR